MSVLRTLCLSQACHLAKERYAKGMRQRKFRHHSDTRKSCENLGLYVYQEIIKNSDHVDTQNLCQHGLLVGT